MAASKCEIHALYSIHSICTTHTSGFKEIPLNVTSSRLFQGEQETQNPQSVFVTLLLFFQFKPGILQMTKSPCCHCFNQAVLMVHIMSERLQAVIAVIQGLQDKSNNLNFRRIFGYMKPHWRGNSGGYLCSHVRCDIILSIRWKLKSNSSPFWKTAVRLASPFPFLFSAVSSALQPAQRAMNNSGWLWPGQRPLNTQVCLLTSSLLPSTLVSHCSLLRCDSQFDINHLLAILPLAQAPCWSSCCHF